MGSCNSQLPGHDNSMVLLLCECQVPEHTCDHTLPGHSSSFACPKWFGIQARSPGFKWAQESGSYGCVRYSPETTGRLGVPGADSDAKQGAYRVQGTHRDLCSCSKALVLPL